MDDNKRYFRTTNASRRYLTGSFAVEFDKVLFSGGSWLGVFETGNDQIASELNEYGAPVREITKQEFEDLKKNKGTVLQQSYLESPQPREPERVKVVDSIDDLLQLDRADFEDDVPKDTPPKKRRRTNKKKEPVS